MRKLYLAAWLLPCLMLAWNTSIAQFAGTSECECLNNQTEPGNGQFRDQVMVKSGVGEVWSVASIEGLYKMSSEAPPANPIPIEVGTILEEINPGVFFLEGKRKETMGWGLTLTNGTETLEVNSFHKCKYNNPEILTEDEYCITSENNVYLSVPIDLYSNVDWTTTNGNIIENNVDSIRVKWGENTGSASVELSIDVMPSEFGNGTACHFDISKEVTLIDDATICAFLLPVELISFRAIKSDEGVKLNWITEGEVNMDFFSIEVSNDGQLWEELDRLSCSNKLEKVEYNFTHYTKVEMLKYYRLRMVEYDGRYTYSNVETVFPKMDTKSNLSIYPNPSSGIFKLKDFNNSEIHKIVIESLDANVSVQKFSQFEEIDLSGYKNGMYNIYITTSNGLIIKRIIKL